MIQSKSELKSWEHRLVKASETMIGYPINLAADYSACFPFLQFHLNNVGDPYSDSLYQINAKELERMMLAWFFRLFHLPGRSGWGYLTSGGTEGNIYSLWLARERFPNATLYFSKAAHYSVPKAAGLLRMNYQIIPAHSDGTIDRAALAAQLQKHTPESVILSLTAGTTMKGAVDDVRSIAQDLKSHGITFHHIHVDAALMGPMLPFWNKDRRIDFTLPIDSLTFSGHKFLGVPFPCGVVLTRKQYIAGIQQSIEYIGSKDATLTGSRNGHAALFLWYAIQRLGKKGIAAWVKQCEVNARYLYQKLQASGYPSARNDGSITILLKRPSDAIVRTWQLAVQGEWAHVVVMPHVTKSLIDRFLKDLLKK